MREGEIEVSGQKKKYIERKRLRERERENASEREREKTRVREREGGGDVCNNDGGRGIIIMEVTH